MTTVTPPPAENQPIRTGWPARELPFVVDAAHPRSMGVHPAEALGHMPFEAIAAFNHDGIAIAYAKQAKADNPRFKYRVICADTMKTLYES